MTLRFSDTKAPIALSLEALALTGTMGPLELGVSKADTARRLPPPEGTYATDDPDTSVCWQYGEVDIHFEPDDSLGLIIVKPFSPYRKSAAFPVDWWILDGRPTYAAVRDQLRKRGIGFATFDDAAPDMAVCRLRASQVRLSFVRDDADVPLEAMTFGAIAKTNAESGYFDAVMNLSANPIDVG